MSPLFEIAQEGEHLDTSPKTFKVPIGLLKVKVHPGINKNQEDLQAIGIKRKSEPIYQYINKEGIKALIIDFYFKSMELEYDKTLNLRLFISNEENQHLYIDGFGSLRGKKKNPEMPKGFFVPLRSELELVAIIRTITSLDFKNKLKFNRDDLLNMIENVDVGLINTHLNENKSIITSKEFHLITYEKNGFLKVYPKVFNDYQLEKNLNYFLDTQVPYLKIEPAQEQILIKNLKAQTFEIMEVEIKDKEEKSISTPKSNEKIPLPTTPPYEEKRDTEEELLDELPREEKKLPF